VISSDAAAAAVALKRERELCRREATIIIISHPSMINLRPSFWHLNLFDFPFMWVRVELSLSPFHLLNCIAFLHPDWITGEKREETPVPIDGCSLKVLIKFASCD
jgi:hypothetical protein